MVSKTRLYYRGLDDFRAPAVPKAPRSLRRNPHKKSSTGSEICPFELLAAVAGKLLQASESSVSSTGSERKEHISNSKEGVKQELLEVKPDPLSLDYLDQGCCGENEFVPEPSNVDLKIESKVLRQQSDSDSGLEHASIITTAGLKEVNTNVKLEACSGNNVINVDLFDVQTDTVVKQCEDLTVKSCLHHDPSACFTRHRNNVKIGIRDDDENFISFNPHMAKTRALRWQSRAGYRRIRKILTTSKQWKTVPQLKDHGPSNASGFGFEPFDLNRKNMYLQECFRAETGSKRPKLFHHSSKSDFVQETSSESISNLPAAKAVTSSVINLKSSFQSKDRHVKLSIKSFNVPELYIEMPEASTVASLKRAVMEAVTVILEGELHVGVLLQGKKIRDDSMTLQQTGISVNSDTLGFMLEPNFRQDSQNKLSFSPPYDNLEPPAIMNCSSDPTLATTFDSVNENNQGTQKVTAEEIVDTKAIVPIKPLNAEALSIVPMNHKLNRRSELSQRRTRRPFSVSEVEALVKAVESFGTGRCGSHNLRLVN